MWVAPNINKNLQTEVKENIQKIKSLQPDFKLKEQKTKIP